MHRVHFGDERRNFLQLIGARFVPVLSVIMCRVSFARNFVMICGETSDAVSVHRDADGGGRNSTPTVVNNIWLFGTNHRSPSSNSALFHSLW
jgi:hypothetical protein